MTASRLSLSTGIRAHLRFACVCLSLIFYTATAVPEDRSPADQWFLDHDLFPIRDTKQKSAVPGALIALLPTGEIYYATPDAEFVKALPPGDAEMTVKSEATRKAVETGALANFLTLGIAGKIKASKSVAIQQAEFQGKGYTDDEREEKILKEGSWVVTRFEKFQTEYGAGKYVPVYFIQDVYTTANLHVEGARNLLLGGAVNSDIPTGCTDLVTVPTDGKAGGDAKPDEKKGANDTDNSSSGKKEPNQKKDDKKVADAKAGADKVKDAVNSLSSKPGGGAIFCTGRGGKDELIGTKQVPVAMNICNIYYWPNDDSYNCRPARKDIRY